MTLVVTSFISSNLAIQNFVTPSYEIAIVMKVCWISGCSSIAAFWLSHFSLLTPFIFFSTNTYHLQVILFSDILTPLTGMNIPFDILKSKGPVIHSPIRTAADVAQVRELVPDEAVPYVGQALTALRSEV